MTASDDSSPRDDAPARTPPLSEAAWLEIEALRAMFSGTACGAPASEEAARRVHAFLERIQGDPTLQQRFAGATTRNALLARLVEIGGPLGYDFTEADVVAAMPDRSDAPLSEADLDAATGRGPSFWRRYGLPDVRD